MAKRKFQVQVEDIEEILEYNEEKRFESRELLTKGIEKLSERDKELLKKHYFELLSLQEIADSVGKTYQNTAVMIHDAQIRLRENIKKMIN